jgi:hypothetical protein
MKPRRRRTWCFSAMMVAFFMIACGARTGLPTDSSGFEDGSAAAGRDAGTDVLREADADRERDARDEPAADVYKKDCTDPSIQYVYVVTESAHLYSFHPSTASFAFMTALDCSPYATPFSMAVDRKGVAYVVYSDGQLYRVSLASGRCDPTPWMPGDQGFWQFGMGYSTDQGGPSEKLYLAASGLTGPVGVSTMLGWLDTPTFAIHPVGELWDTGTELTGTGDGRLYGFFQGDGLSAAHLVRLDKTDGSYLDDTQLPGVTLGMGWAFAFWGGDFWFFTAPSDHSVVTRFIPTTSEISKVAETPSEIIVGAGVSTCAPEQ